MPEKLMMETFGFLMNPIFFLIALFKRTNWFIWDMENLHVAIPFLHAPKVMVWATISSRGLIKHFFRHKMITSQIYQDIIHEFVVIQNALDYSRNNLWFMKQEGVQSHQTTEAFDFSNKHFGDCIIPLDYQKHMQSGMG